MPYVKPKIAKETLGVTDDTLRAWGKDGKIKFLIGRGGHRVYDVESFISSGNPTPPIKEQKKYIYCRVSSNKQKEDLDRQVKYLEEKYPSHTVVKEIASGLNFKRKVLQRILDEVIRGSVKEIVVAHRDRLCRIAWEHFLWLFKHCGTTIVVDSEDAHLSPETELAEDLLSIIHVFSCRHYGQRRKYTTRRVSENNEENKNEKRSDESSKDEETEEKL